MLRISRLPSRWGCSGAVAVNSPSNQRLQVTDICPTRLSIRLSTNRRQGVLQASSYCCCCSSCLALALADIWIRHMSSSQPSRRPNPTWSGWYILLLLWCYSTVAAGSVVSEWFPINCSYSSCARIIDRAGHAAFKFAKNARRVMVERIPYFIGANK